MRRTMLAVLLALGTALAVLPASAATGVAPAAPPTASPLPLPAPAADAAEQALQRALDLFATPPARRAAAAAAAPEAPAARTPGATHAAEASLVLRDLALARPHLTGADRRQADALLARPTDGAGDPIGFGYTTGATRTCTKKLCLHWVTSTGDQPPSGEWVTKSLRTMKRVWRTEVGKLGYRAPRSDGRRGGKRHRFDVYLKELGGYGLYGYCAPEPRRSRRSPGYCVLDNDFSPAQYGGAPATKSLKVTAAHEFFHAIQFGYDVTEDRWLMEASATWMEERFADGADDNRQYLPYGQLGRPGSPLDRYDPEGGHHYGNWAFFEYLSQRHGTHVVKQLWNRVAAGKRRNPYSVKALRGLLDRRRGFVRTFAAYSAANTTPGRFYPEGRSWPAAPTAQRWTLTKADRRASRTTRIDHLASSSVRVKPGTALTGKRWQLRVKVRGPRRVTSPAAQVLVHRTKGKPQSLPVVLNRRGNGARKVPFRHGRVKHVTVTLVNASTRYRCHRGRAAWACRGKPRDDDQKFSVVVKAVKRARR